MKKYNQSALILLMMIGAATRISAQSPDEEITSSSTRTSTGNEFVNGRQLRQMDSIYANDQVITRDVTIPGNANKLIKMADKVSSGSIVKIGVSLLKPGRYDWQILDISGNILRSGIQEINADTKFMDLQLPSLSAGNYHLVLINQVEKRKMKESFSVI